MDLPIPDLTPGEFAEHLRAIGRGEKPFPNSTGSRHHYVPEFVLRRFRSRPSAGRRLFQLDKTDGTCAERRPAEAGWERDLYKVGSTTGQHDGLIEGLFGLAENYAAPSLKRLLADPEGISDSERADVAYLVAIQEQRAPGAIDELQARMAEIGTMELAVELAKMKGSSKRRRRAEEGYRALTDGSIGIAAHRDAVLGLTMASIVLTGERIRLLPWTLLRARGGEFVCSDRPLTMHDPLPPHPWSGPGWISSPAVAATLPLSTAMCLRISPADHRPVSVRSIERQVERINLRTYGWASRYVYGPSPDLLCRLHERAVADPALAPSAAKKRNVVLEDLSTADPAIAEANRERGWDPHIVQRTPDGSCRLMSYEVLDSVDDARRLLTPRPPRRRPVTP